MATFRLPHLASPGILQQIDRRWLLAFFQAHREFLQARGVNLPTPLSHDPIPFDDLVAALADPGEDTPVPLLDALYYVNGLATPEGMSALLDTARRNGLVIEGGDDLTPADVAIQVSLQFPDLLERTHAEQYQTRPRAFDYYQTDADDLPQASIPTPDQLANLNGELNNWFEERRRGRSARVFAFEQAEETLFLIRHGSTFRREGAILDGRTSCVAFRPLVYDVVVYDSRMGELRVHAGLKGEKELYRRAFGRNLFGREDFFPGEQKYDLEPIRERGPACLVCSDVPHIESVRLREVHLAWNGMYDLYETRRATDLFADMRLRGTALPDSARLARAVFMIKFRGAGRARTVTIKPPNVALYSRDEDAGAVENWLSKRGFMNAPSDDASFANPLLVSA